MVFLKKKFTKNNLFFYFFQCNFSVFDPEKVKQRASNIAHNRPRPFFSTVQPRPQPTAHSPKLIFHIINMSPYLWYEPICYKRQKLPYFLFTWKETDIACRITWYIFRVTLHNFAPDTLCSNQPKKLLRRTALFEQLWENQIFIIQSEYWMGQSKSYTAVGSCSFFKKYGLGPFNTFTLQ